MIKIIGKIDGLRRCGTTHPARWVEHPDSRFTEEEILAMSADPLLIVERTAPGGGAAMTGLALQPGEEGTLTAEAAADESAPLPTAAVGPVTKNRK